MVHGIGNKLNKKLESGIMLHNGLEGAFCINAQHSMPMESFMNAKQQIDVTRTSSSN